MTELDQVLKRPCAFLIKMRNPLETLKESLAYLTERNIHVSTLHLHNMNEQEGILIIHCMIEKDRIKYILHLLEKIKGITEMELLESKTSNIYKVQGT